MVEIINRSCTLPIEIPKGCVLFLKQSISNVNTKQQQRKLKRPRKKGKKLYCGREKRQTGGFLNQHDFVYAGRDTVNQAAKVATGVIKNASNELNNIANERINQIITQEKRQNVFFPNFLEEPFKMYTKHHSGY